MTKNYAVRIETFYTNTMVSSLVSVYKHEEYKSALDMYCERCKEAGDQMAMSEGFVRVSLVDLTDNTLDYDMKVNGVKGVASEKEIKVPQGFCEFRSATHKPELVEKYNLI